MLRFKKPARSYKQALLEGPRYMNMLEKLSDYYGNSDTFCGNKASILRKIFDYKFQRCYGCNKHLDKDILCKPCKDKAERIENKYVTEELCDMCGNHHTVYKSYTIECKVCKKDSKKIYNINNVDICYECLDIKILERGEDSETDHESEEEDYDY